MIHKIKVYGFTEDHQDGSGSVTVYPTLEEMKEDWFDGEDDRFQRALKGNNPYEDGYIKDYELEIEVDANGVPTFTGRVSFDVGQ